MNFFDYGVVAFRCRQAMRHVDAADYQYTILSLHLTPNFARECPLPCLDLPRCQRGGKGALHSGPGSRH